ncbi:MAG: TIGR03621 family F420-dependent LLM class oxidoreductase [Acidimicrobiia bacterium]
MTPLDHTIHFGVQAGLITDAAEWLELAIKAEELGFDALYVADHLGVTASPFAALAAAAGVTTTIKLGTYVLNAGVRDPLELASGAATVDVVSNGRMVLGVGAGHTPAEWTMSGRSYPSAAARVGRLGEIVDVVTSLLDGEVTNFAGQYITLTDALLLAPRPVQARLPMLVGGNGFELLRIGGRTSNIVSLTGLGRTLDDGHRHQADWSAAAVDQRVDAVRAAAAGRTTEVVFDALVQHVEITDYREKAAAQFARTAPGLTTSDVLGSPYAHIGTLDEIVATIHDNRARWGFTSYVVRADAIDDAAAILRHL